MTPAAYVGAYVDFEILESGELSMTLSRHPDAQQEIKNLMRRQKQRGTTWVLRRLIEDHFDDSNGDPLFSEVQPEEIGALTGAFLIGYQVERDWNTLEGEIIAITGVWKYGWYAIKNELDVLLTGPLVLDWHEIEEAP